MIKLTVQPSTDTILYVSIGGKAKRLTIPYLNKRKLTADKVKA